MPLNASVLQPRDEVSFYEHYSYQKLFFLPPEPRTRVSLGVIMDVNEKDSCLLIKPTDAIVTDNPDWIPFRDILVVKREIFNVKTSTGVR